MPKKAALKFRNVLEAVEWVTSPPPEQAHMHRGFQAALIRFTLTRADPKIRESYVEGARLFEKAAGKANALAFELEAQYLKIRDENAILDKKRVDALARALLIDAQACHRWTLDGAAGAHFDTYLSIISRLEDGTVTPVPVSSQVEVITGVPECKSNEARNRRGLSRDDVLTVPPGNNIPLLTWWTADPKRIRTVALNMRRLSFKLQSLAKDKSHPGGGRPRDGDRIELIDSARELGINVPAVSFLMSAFAVELPSHFNRPVPKELRPMRHGGRPAGPLSKLERAWLEDSQQKWFSRLKEAPRDQRRKRRKDTATFQRLLKDEQCHRSVP